MKEIAELVPDVLIDESLNRLSKKVLFPKKLQKANEILAKGGLPNGLKVGENPVFDIPNAENPIGTLIKQTRLQRNLSQEALSNLLGMDKSLISKLENNDYSVSMETILHVFKVLDAELSFVVKLQH
jgi:DNA-binding XRE family transcriptional regulator